MKRLAGILGLLGGIGAILWAMRDRLVSVAIPREPKPPALRQPERYPPPRPQRVTSQPEPEEETPSQTLTDVTGIGPVYATRLEAAGIATPADLARASTDKVAEATGVTAKRAEGWIASAQKLVAD